MTVTAAEILADAGEILSDPKAWLQGRYSNSGGFGSDGGDPKSLERATCYCSLGAIREAYRRRDIRIAGDMTDAADALHEAVGYAVEMWNDAPGRAHADVVEMFAKARDFAEENGW